MALPDVYKEYRKSTTNEVISSGTHCVLLNKALYGLVQAARQWYKRFKMAIQSLDFVPSAEDPCLFIKNGKRKRTDVLCNHLGRCRRYNRR